MSITQQYLIDTFNLNHDSLSIFKPGVQNLNRIERDELLDFIIHCFDTIAVVDPKAFDAKCIEIQETAIHHDRPGYTGYSGGVIPGTVHGKSFQLHIVAVGEALFGIDVLNSDNLSIIDLVLRNSKQHNELLQLFKRHRSEQEVPK